MRDCGPDSGVGIATGYRLDYPAIECRWGRDFTHQSRPALGLTQPPVQRLPGLSGGKVRSGREADPSTPSSTVFKKEYSYTSTPPTGRTACTEPQCLYSRAIPLLPLWPVQPVQSLSACSVQPYLYSPYGLYGLYRASVPVQYSYTSTPPMGCTACTEPQCLYKCALNI